MPSSNDITELDLVIGYRDSQPCVITLTDDSGVVRDLTGNTYEMHASNQRFPIDETLTSPDFFWIITPTIAGAPSPLLGQIQFAPTSGNYDDIPIADFSEGGKFTMYYDIVEINSALKRTILEGKLRIQRVVRTVD